VICIAILCEASQSRTISMLCGILTIRIAKVFNILWPGHQPSDFVLRLIGD